MIKILHAADLHLGARFRGLPGPKAALRRQQLLELPDRLAELCRDEECSLVLLAGDLLDTPAGDPASTAALQRFAEQVGVPVVISPGNHDYITPDSPYVTAPWPENVHIFRQPRLERLELPELDCVVWGAGYRSMDCEGLLRDFHAADGDRLRLMVLHGDPLQLDSPNCPITRAQVTDSGLDYLAMGHIHRAGGFRAGRTFCAWPGCPMGRGFDETGRKGVLLAEVESGHADARFVALPGGGYDVMTRKVTGDAVRELLEQLPPEAENLALRITLQGESMEPGLEQIRRGLEDRLFHLELRDNRMPPAALWEAAGRDSLEGVFFRLLKEELERSGPEDQEILTLAARISRSLLDGREVELP